MKIAPRIPKLGWLAAILAVAWPLHAQVTISTNRYDGARTGANLAESKLTPSNVNVNGFGKLYSYPVDGSVYAQPLYVPNVTINGTVRNVLYVATMNDKVYAFDADSASPSPLWTRDFTSPPSVTPVPIADIVAPNLNIVGNVGIQSTPVIDTSTGTIYLLARTKENGSYVQRLHALNIASGASRLGSPVTITGAVSGTAPDSTPGPNGPVVTFNPKMQSQRAALALSNGVVLIGWASHEDMLPYHGWVMGYDATTLAKVGTFCVTPDAYAGGIWQGGRAPTIDAAGNVYFVTGNGRWDGTRNFGDSVLKFSVSRAGFSLLDFFTPANHEALNAADDDLSGSSFTLLPGTNLLLGGGKEGVLYLLDAANLGRMAPADAQIPQRIDVGGGHVMGGPAFWNSSTLGPVVYHWAEDDVLKAYRLSGGRLAVPPYAQGPVASPGHPGGSLTVSANAATGGTGILWSSMPTNQDGIHGLVPGIVRAFNAETLNEIWNSEQNAARDRAGTLMKFVPPVVVNGRVYMPSHDNAVPVYGLLPPGSGPGPTPPGTISIDFVGSNVTAMGASETAGAMAARNWNAAFGAALSTPQALVDSTGTTTSATVTWSAAGAWQLPTTDQPGNARMMKGYLDSTSTSGTTVTVAGLPNASHDVYVYADGDNKIYERTAAYTISGPGITATTISLTDAASANFGGTFTRAANSAGNYIRFTIAATGFTIDAIPTAPATGTRRAPINGIQIVPAAPPPPPPDFTVTESPHSRTVTRGSAATYTITVGSVNGFNGTASLSASGTPAGTTAAFNPATITGSGNSTLTLATASSTPTGTFTVIVTGTSDGTTRSAHVKLTVDALPAAGDGAISVDFVGSSPVAMANGEVAGVVEKSNWNNAFGAVRTDPQALVDETGRATSATLTWSSPAGTWALPITDQPGNMRMMKGYLDTSSTSTTSLTVAGLAQGAYDVYVYADGDNKIYDRAAAYTLSGPGISPTTITLTDPARANFGGVFTRADGSAGNYLRFSITGTGFTIVAAPTSPEGGTRRAPVNGLQIVPTSIAPPGPAAAIGIDFAGSNSSAMAAGESAGVVPQGNWNSAAGAVSSSPLLLVDETGATTGAVVTWTANGGWAVPIPDVPGNMRLMRGYLDTSVTSVTTVTVSGLASGTYDVYVYADGDNREYSRSAIYRLSAPGSATMEIGLTDLTGTNFSGGFAQATGSAGNYVKFTIVAGGFTIAAIPSSASSPTLRAPINAIQIVPRSP